MEQINKVEILGRIGSVRTIPMIEGGPCVHKFSVATEYLYKGKEGQVIIDCTWHNVIVTESYAGEYAWLEKGKGVHVWGRIHNTRYTDANGIERVISEIVAKTVVSVKE
jgi:single-strand DNA-binding protein